MFVKYSGFVLFLATLSHETSILAILPMPSYSHQIAYRNLWKQLSLRGHQVTLITTDPVKNSTLSNLTEIDMSWTYKFLSNVSTRAAHMNMWNGFETFRGILYDISTAQLSYAPIQKLIHGGRKFDVVLVEFLFSELLGFGQIFKCPTILFSSFDVVGTFYQVMGNPTHPVLYPDVPTPFVTPLSFKERVLSTLFSWHETHFFEYVSFPEKERILRQYFNTTVKLKKLLDDVDMLFINTNSIIQGARAIGPNTINVGDPRRAVSAKPLPKDLATFLDGAKDGFIYFSLGSNVKSKDLSKDTLAAIIGALGEVPYKVLWKFEADHLPGKPANIKLIKWAPQQSILSHPNIKLFVTQGGLQSMEETIFAEVPCVVIPYFGDQVRNARIMSNKGMAKVINRHPSVEKDDLKNAILEVITDPKYKNSVKRLKELALDTPMTGLEKAVWWTEYVIRHKGAKHLRNPAADLPFYQYYLIDVLSFLILTVTLLLSATVFIIRKVIKLLYKYSNKLFINNKKRQ